MEKSLFSILMSVIFSFVVQFSTAQENVNYQLSTHILDIHLGKPASGVIIRLYKWNPDNLQFEDVDAGVTDENGRIANFLPTTGMNEGAYKLRFETQEYFKSQNIKSIYPLIEVVFTIEDKEHYHIPITVSANGYSTYRGS